MDQVSFLSISFLPVKFLVLLKIFVPLQLIPSALILILSLTLILMLILILIATAAIICPQPPPEKICFCSSKKSTDSCYEDILLQQKLSTASVVSMNMNTMVSMLTATIGRTKD